MLINYYVNIYSHIINKNFIFYYNEQHNGYIGKSTNKFIKYDLYLEIHENEQNIEISRNYDGKKYILIDINNTTSVFLQNLRTIEFSTTTLENDILVFTDNNNNYLIEFPNYIYKNKHILLFEILSNKINLVLSDTDKYEIIINKNGLFNRWIYNIPIAFIIKKKMHYKILLMDIDTEIISHLTEAYLYSPWIDSQNLNDNYNDILDRNNIRKKLPYTEYYLIDIDYNGINLKFNNKMSIACYVKYCIFYQKTDCLNSVFNQYLDHHFNSKESTKEEIIVKNLTRYNLFNNPYSHYYSYKSNYYESITLKNPGLSTVSNYCDRVKRKAYPGKYILYEQTQNIFKCKIYDKKYFTQKLNPFDTLDNHLETENNITFAKLYKIIDNLFKKDVVKIKD